MTQNEKMKLILERRAAKKKAHEAMMALPLEERLRRHMKKENAMLKGARAANGYGRGSRTR